MAAEQKLEIGPGDHALGSGWDTLTADPFGKADYHCRWGRETFPIANDTYDKVFASHVIEHVPWYKINGSLEEVLRILKPGGSFEVWTVDFDVVVHAYLSGEIPDAWRRYNSEGDLMKWINGRIFAYEKQSEGDTDLNCHRSCFTRKSLKAQLQAAGFTGVIDTKRNNGEDHGPVDMGVLSFKPSTT